MTSQIINATKNHAPFIAQIVMGALGTELCEELAGGKENLHKVERLFTQLAGDSRSQYSYLNTYLAVDEEGTPVGGIVAYDGAALHELRKAFVRAAGEILGWTITDEDMAEWGDETPPDQIYIDSLYVSPDARGNGIATELIRHVMRNRRAEGKTFGLLVEPANAQARHLYESIGFRKVGVSNFFSTPMIHLRMAAPDD